MERDRLHVVRVLRRHYRRAVHRTLMGRTRTYRMGYYVLDHENLAIPWPDQKMLQWARIHEQMVREGRTTVKQEDIGDIWLSTVFLGLDHNYASRIRFENPSAEITPHIFET